MIATEQPQPSVYDPSITCQQRIFYGMSMSLNYRFGAGQWELLTRTCRTGLACYAPSKYANLPTEKPRDFHRAVEIAGQWLAINANHIYRADQDRMGETARDYLR